MRKPPGCVVVRTDIPFGNACDVSVTASKDITEIEFAADPHGGPEALWFCLRVETGSRPPKRLRLTLKHAHNMLGCGTLPALRPVTRTKERDWERLGAPDVTDLPDGRRLASWSLDAPKGFLDVALCYPYGPDDVDALVRETDGYWTADVIGVSPSARPIVCLSNDPGAKGSARPGVYLVARQHSGETPGSWVLDGFLRHVATLGGAAPVVRAIPLSNIDGVVQGDYGKDNFPYDLNRAWGAVPMRHETHVIQRDVRRWRERCKGLLGIDFHAPGGTESVGVYAFLPDPGKLPDAHKSSLAWAAAMAESLTPEFAAKEFGRVATYASRWETPTFARFFCETLHVDGVSIETSYALAGERVLTREDYREIGARVARAVMSRIS